MIRPLALAPLLLVLGAAGAARAEAPVPETAALGAASVTLHPHAFLTAEELATLRLVLTNEQALGLFVPEGGGFAALAVSPDDGFIRGGQPVASATALSALPDAETARTRAIEACEAARAGAQPCLIVLEIAPLPAP
jgi:hypothetical protein